MYARIPEKGSFEFRSIDTSCGSSSNPNFIVDHIEEEYSYHQTPCPGEQEKVEGEDENKSEFEKRLGQSRGSYEKLTKQSWLKYFLMKIDIASCNK